MKWKDKNSCVPNDILQQFVDGELVPKVEEKVEKHISSCQSCLSIVEERRTFIARLNESLNLIDEDKIEIPEFNPNRQEQFDIQKRRNIYWWSAAAIFLVTISTFIITNSNKKNLDVNYLYHEMNSEIDANKPWHEQSSTIYILNESGEIIDKIENL